MEFFNSLTLDLKMLVVGIAGCALLALFSGNRRTEKRYMLALALLTIAGVYRFNHFAPDEGETRASPQVVTAPPQHKPLVSTSAK
jgi:hypothetical protein